MGSNIINVDLTKSLSSGKVEPSSLLQVNAREKLFTILKQFVNYSESALNKIDSSLELEFSSDRLNNTVFISGQRGAGKTTFLRTVLLERLKDTKDKILPLAFIDPTLINTNQHILVDIIAKFKQVVERNLSSCGNEDKINQFNKNLEEMAEGLKLLNSKVSNFDKDASWFLNKALKHAASGQNLEVKFHQLIDTASHILGQNLFVIAIDDVDNDTTKAYEVLELIRRYLTHSKIAVIISGDLKLYSHIVKNKKMAELKPENVVNDRNTNELVEHLEQQYLAKVLPIDQRVELKSLNNLIEQDGFSINIKLGEDLDCELNSYLKDIFSESLNLDKRYLSSYIKFYLKQPVRTAFQILKSLPEGHSANSQEFRDSLINAIQNSYIGALRKENIDVDKLVNRDVHQNAIGLALFELCSKYAELETGFYARPDGIDESYNAAQLFLSQVISSYLSSEKQHSVGGAIKVMLTAGASANMYMNHVIDKMLPTATKQDYINYIGLNRDQNLFSFAAHFSPFVFPKGISNTRMIYGGVARLPRNSSPGKHFPAVNSLYYGGVDKKDIKKIATLNNLVTEHNHNDRTFIEFLSAKTVILSSHSMIAKSEGRDYLSAYCLLAMLAEFLTCDDDGVSDKLIQLTSIQTFGAPGFADVEAVGEGSNSDEEEEVGVNSNSENVDNNFHAKLVTLIKKWKGLNSNVQLSPLLIGKIWARIMYSIASVSDVAKKQKVQINLANQHDVLLGTLLSRFVFSIVNAVLIEEVRFSKSINDDLKYKFSKSKNVASSSNEFLRNLTIATSVYTNGEMSRCLPITTSLLTCPLLWPYLGEWKSHSNENTIFNLIKGMINDQFELEVLKDIFGSDYECSAIGDFQKGLGFVSRLPISGCKYSTAVNNMDQP